MPEFRSKLEDLMPTEELLFDATAGFGSVYKRFLGHSIAHPAKMNTRLTEFLIERFTEKGDLVLDPMAGSGQTGVISALHGRDAVCVDIEDKFYKWMEQARKKVERQNTLFGSGKIHNICGDARNLSQILKQADVVVTSPPYSGNTTNKRDSDAKLRPNRSYRLCGVHGEAEGQIGNLKYGVDAVISSPPYANLPVISYDNTEWTKHFQKQLKEKGYIEWQGKRYTEEEWRALNHGRIDGRTAKGMKKGDIGYSQVDVVVTSPPYAESISKHAGGCKGKVFSGEFKVGESTRTARTYSESEENIGNLSFVDTVITSPPYEGSLEDRKGGGILTREGAGPNSEATSTRNLLPCKYSSSKENIGNLKKETYLEAMLRVYVEMFKVLKPDGKAIIVIKPFIRNKKVVDLPYHTWLLLKKAGFNLVKLFKLRLKTQSFWRILYTKKHPEVAQIKHEYILVCQK